MTIVSSWRPRFLLLALVVALTALVACGGDIGDDDDSAYYETEAYAAATEAAAEETSSTQRGQSRSASVAQEASADEASEASGDDGGDSADRRLVSTSAMAQSRVVVHTARMSLVVNDVVQAVGEVRAVAAHYGGWIVSSDQTARHSGAIAIRVPAQSLDQALSDLETVGIEVESLQVTSQDVTEEFVDSESRLNSLTVTRARLLTFLDRAVDVEDALLVQEELSKLQLQIEQIQGRLNYLRQVAAFSLIEVELKLAAVSIEVDAGPDGSYRIGQIVRFRAAFEAPPDIDEYSFVWDFGDGTSASGSGSVLTPEGNRITATVNHTYGDDRDSPFIVTIRLLGAGDGGRAEGSDSLLVAVSRVPTIEVFAGDNRTVEEGDKADYSASFTRPSELWDYEYQWDFGDGSPSTIGNPEEGATRVEVSHKYSDYRSRPYRVVFTVSAMSDAGRVTSSGSFEVSVTEGDSLVVGGWDVGSTAAAALYALSAVGRAVLQVLIWLAHIRVADSRGGGDRGLPGQAWVAPACRLSMEGPSVAPVPAAPGPASGRGAHPSPSLRGPSRSRAEPTRRTRPRRRPVGLMRRMRQPRPRRASLGSSPRARRCLLEPGVPAQPPAISPLDVSGPLIPTSCSKSKPWRWLIASLNRLSRGMLSRQTRSRARLTVRAATRRTGEPDDRDDVPGDDRRRC